MAYIGNIPTTAAFITDTFNGTGSQTAFTMSAAPATTTSILVSVSGVLQDPSTYSVSGTTLTFSAAPPSGTGNISVRFLGIPASGVTSTAYRTQTEFTATAGQTTFSVPSYTVGYIDVYRNGALLGSADFTATNGTTVVLTNPASSGDLVETVSFYVSSVLNAIPAQNNAVIDSYILSMAGSKLTGSQSIPKATLPTGSVLQVKYFQLTTAASTTSTSMTDTGLTVSITPTSASNQILVMTNMSIGMNTNNVSGSFNFVRNSTTIGISTASTTVNFGTNVCVPNSNHIFAGTMMFLDSPATTSATTYKVQWQAQTGGYTLYMNRTPNLNGGTDTYQGGYTSSITVMEIAV